MTQWDVRALETNFEGWRATRVPDLTISEAFERYAIEAVFKDAEYSDEEISSGLLGGGNDGGVDGAYLTINDKIIFGDTPVPDNPIRATLWLIQAKNSNSYTEAPLIKFRTFVEDALDYNKPVDQLNAYSSRVKDFIGEFRDSLGEAIGSITDININFMYITKSDHNPSEGVFNRGNELAPVVIRHLSAAKVSCDFWGARPLLDAKRAQPQRTYSLEVVNHFSHQGSFIGIARLDKFAHFLTDEAGNLRQNFLEPNVRDYAGRRNKVNEDIRRTLDAGALEEFWWLNNGITILGEDCNFAGGKLNIKTPEIVNGLQTSTEIFSYFKDNISKCLSGRMLNPVSRL